jgi:small conductance mechanosensitive channel
VYQVDAAATDVCNGGADFICDWAYDLTGSETFAEALDWVVERPLKVIAILLVAWALNRLVGRAILRGEERMVVDRERKLAERQQEEVEDGRFEDMDLRARQKIQELAIATEQAKQRAKTLGSVMRSAATVTIYTFAILMSLGEFDINLGPLIAGAGIAGVALGFGAQSIVKDFLSGFFMLVEDQYAVGDIVDVGAASGVVEGIGLRTTRIRDVNGTLWHVPNGEILRVGNKSQQWARAVLDIEVAYDTDIDLASRVIKDVADAVWLEHLPKATIIEEPEIWGVEMFGESAIAIRLVVKTEPGEQFMTARVIRGRLVEAFEREGIEIPFPQRVIWTRHKEDPAAEVE